MKVDKELISRLETLAMLKLSDQEKENVMKDLNEILAMVRKLEEFDTSGIDPLIHISGAQNVFRDDIPQEHLEREKGLKNAKSRNDEFIIVPKVIK